jgi:hypothetical protein
MSKNMLRFLLMWFALSTSCMACSCSGPPRCGGIGPESHFIIGIPSARRILPSSNKDFFRRAAYTVRVTESFSKNIEAGSTIEVKTGLGGGDCGWVFDLDTTYLVDIYVGEDGSFNTSICSSTATLAEVQPLLEQLRAIKSDRRPPSLVGSISEDRGPLNGYGARTEADFLAGIHLNARSSTGATYSAITDKAGTFRFDVLPAGAYTLSPDLPARLKVWHGYSEDRDPVKIKIPQTVGTAETSCRTEIPTEPTAGIKGNVILPPGAALHVSVVAFLLHEGKEIEVRDETPEANGTFDLASMPSGTYRIVVRDDDNRRRVRFSAKVEVYDARVSEITLKP